MYARFAEIATKYGCTPPQLALAWLLHQGDDIIPIPGMIDDMNSSRLYSELVSIYISHNVITFI